MAAQPGAARVWIQGRWLGAAEPDRGSEPAAAQPSIAAAAGLSRSSGAAVDAGTMRNLLGLIINA
jgi:hypothetical protein